MKYNTFLFDLDGTLTESGLGITRSVAYACAQMGYLVPEQAILDRFVGPPLIVSFMEYCGMSEDEARQATEHYRVRYRETGWKENRVYTGIPGILKSLKQRGAYIAIASAKPQVFVEKILTYFGLAPYFDKIVGIKFETTHADKCELIAEALPESYDKTRAAMIGDRKYDTEAARKMGVRAVGVAYGYGSREELEASGAQDIAMTVSELREILLDGAAPERGCFITFEGADGCGKSTQLRLLADRLTACGHELVITREPGGCPASEAIRELVLTPEFKGMSSECEALLYAASRAEHARQVILPALENGKFVLCDRFLDSSIAYQAYGRELGEDFIRQINAAIGALSPDRTLLFVGKREVVSQRLRANENLDRIEAESDAFVCRVYDAYERIHAAEPERVHIIDSNRSIEEIFEDVCADIGNLLV